MKLISSILAVAVLVFLNAAFIFFVFPDTTVGRAISWFYEKGTSSNVSTAEPLNKSFVCEEPLPEFTLGPLSNPSANELSSICECMWASLDEQQQATSRLIREAKGGEASSAVLESFVTQFGGVLKNCGANEL